MGQTLRSLGSDIFLIEHLWEPSLCRHMVEVAGCCEFLSPPAGSSLQGELRSNEVLPLHQPSSLLASTLQLLLNPLSLARDLLAKHYDVTLSHIELYAIERFQPGQAHKRHQDGLVLTNRYAELAKGIPARDVSIIGFLNQEFEGGDLLFDRQSVKVKPSLGSVVLFPACYTHPYQALPVLRGCKYTLTCWLLH
ncbi:MAG: 2OG-Fe(II) oxygenase [Leptolyngbyaceae cyanobacterium bins.302]|nr:2OG-Fe(II) oxygenase [Leptolyngbyaceae cyanobacterium bins.302]